MSILQLLRLLADGRFHSGEELGTALGISRSAVWKRLQQLSAEHVLALHKVRGKGYRLEQPLSLLSVGELSARLPSLTLWVEDCVDSTNAMALKKLAEPAVALPFAILAESQSAGRGRRGRHWVSPYGQSLYLSYAIRVERAAQLQALSLVVGLAVRRALQSFGVSNVGLKWPNDLLVSGCKIAGILLELSGDPADVCHVVIGIGINANLLDANGIDQAWTSVQRVTGCPVDRNALAAVLLEQLDCVLAEHREHGFAAFHEEWEAGHLWQGCEVRLTSGVHEIDGRVLGVTLDGALRLLVDGVERTYSGGELTLRLRHDS